MSRYDKIVEVNKNIDTIEEIEKFNPFHDSKGKFSSSRGMKTYSANPKTKAGQMAIARSTQAGYGAVMNVHRESKGENIRQNDIWINSGQKPSPSAMARAQANNPQSVAAARARAATNRVKGTMGATKEGQPIGPTRQQSQQTATKPATQNQQTAAKPTAQNQAQPKAGTVHVNQKMKSGATMDADFDTSKVAGAKNKEFRGTAEGRDLTKSFDATKETATDYYSFTGENRYTNKVADMQGFNSPPKVVSKAEFKQLAQDCGDEMYRTWGGGTMDGKHLTGKGFMNEFNTSGDMKMNGNSGRVYGDGFYVTSAKMQHGRNGQYTKSDVDDVKRESRCYGDGKSTTQMTWLSKPNIITNAQLTKEWNNLSLQEQAKFGNHKNTYACAKGYDAVYTKSRNYMAIFNRSKLAVLE